jgi:N-methylhydantoinase A
MRLRIGVDTGGTFTDIVGVDREGGQVFTTKVPSTPQDPAQALLQGISALLASIELTADAVEAVAHGTTVATNALLQEPFEGLALITTQGFRHLLEIARQSVPSGYGNSYFWVKPDRIVPLERVFEVTERMTFTGEVLTPLQPASAEAAARWCEENGIRAAGICLLHAYANPAHEEALAARLRERLPHLAISLSSEVLPEYREYERAMTTLVDAYVKPHVRGYLQRATDAVERAYPQRPFLVMTSNGGLAGAANAPRKPVATVLSGPAAGALGASFLAQAAGYPHVITLDAGGTSTDVCLVERGQPPLTGGGRVGRFPVKVPMIDIVSVGTGGGSIASVTAEGGLAVGPRSAGADPGPMCYGRGGLEMTLTDANLVLGRIGPALLGGALPLDRTAAERGLATLAQRAGIEPQALAAGIVEIANWNQANAIRQLTVRQGLDPAGFVLVAFGGSGPMQAGRLLEILGIGTALIPVSPGTVSAFGLLAVDIRTDQVVTRVLHPDQLDPQAVETLFQRLEAQARAALQADGVAEADAVFERAADMRYFGQASELRVTLPRGPWVADHTLTALERFHAAHQRAYGYAYSEAQTAEFVNWRVIGLGRIPRPTLPLLAPKRAPGAAAARRRKVVFDGHGEVKTPCWERRALSPDQRLDGPLVVEEFGSTTVVPPGFTVTVDPLGNLVLQRATG